MRGVFGVAVGLAVACLALAQTKTIEGVPIGIGDSVEKVKTALGTTMEPEPAKSVQPNTKQLRLKTRGIWAFFGEDGKVYTIRLDAPFPGNVGGVKIGDPRTRLIEKLGKPVKVLKKGMSPFKQEESYLYYIDDRTTATFEFDEQDQVATVFIFK